MKLLWVVFSLLVFSLIISVSYYFLAREFSEERQINSTVNSSNNPQVAEPNPSIVLPSPSVTTQLVPEDWKTYTSKSQAFTARTPADITIQTTTNGERFLKLGPTQTASTKLSDGLSILVRKGILNEQSLEELVRQKHQEASKDMPSNTLSSVETVLYGPLQGFKFGRSISEKTDFIYFQKSPTEYIEVIDNTVDPEGTEPKFKALSGLIISSLEF